MTDSSNHNWTRTGAIVALVGIVVTIVIAGLQLQSGEMESTRQTVITSGDNSPAIIGNQGTVDVR